MSIICCVPYTSEVDKAIAQCLLELILEYVINKLRIVKKRKELT